MPETVPKLVSMVSMRHQHAYPRPFSAPARTFLEAPRASPHKSATYELSQSLKLRHGKAKAHGKRGRILQANDSHASPLGYEVLCRVGFLVPGVGVEPTLL